MVSGRQGGVLVSIKALRSLYEAERVGLLCSDDLRDLDHTTRYCRLVSIWGDWTVDVRYAVHFLFSQPGRLG